MRKYLIFFGIALLGGVSALGLANLFTKSQPTEFGARQNFQFASKTEELPQANFVNAAQVVTPAVVHIKIITSCNIINDERNNSSRWIRYTVISNNNRHQ